MSAGRVKDSWVHSALPAPFRAFPCLCCNEQGSLVVDGMAWKEPWVRQEAVIQNSTVLWNPWCMNLPRREGRAEPPHMLSTKTWTVEFLQYPLRSVQWYSRRNGGWDCTLGKSSRDLIKCEDLWGSWIVHLERNEGPKADEIKIRLEKYSNWASNNFPCQY